MNNLLQRIADYFQYEYTGHDKTAPKMELTVDDLRYITSMNAERCRAEAELREVKLSKYNSCDYKCLSKSEKLNTNADRIRNMSDDELADFISNIISQCESSTSCNQHCFGYYEEYCNSERCLKWLQSETIE